MIHLGCIILIALAGGAAIATLREALSNPKIGHALRGRGGWWL